MINCDSNRRCATCPIERLVDAEDRVLAGSVVRSVTSKALSNRNEYEISLSTLRIAVEERGAHMYADDKLTAPIIGATAMYLTGKCNVEI